MKNLGVVLLVVVLAPFLGCLASGVERKLSAKLQNRVGPPLLQPLYDVLKLFNKESFIVNRYQNIYVVAYLIFIIISLVMLVLQMDLLMILFVFTIANIALIVGASVTGSPYSKIGSKRETINLIVYEPVLVLYFVGMYIVTGSFGISKLKDLDKPLILYMPLIFISMLVVMLIKLKKSPFDYSGSHESHQELVRGITTEFSGPALALIEIAHWYEFVFLMALMFLFWSTNIFIGIVISILTFLFTIVVDNISARVNWQWMLKFIWPALNVLCIANVVYIFSNKRL